MESIFCACPQCRSSAYLGGVYVILILRAWQISHKDQQSLTKLNVEQVAYVSGSFPSLNNIYSSGGNSSFVIQELIMQHFLCFSKDKSPKLQCYLEQDKQQLRPSQIISINYLDLDQAYATMSLKFKVNPYIKIVLSKTQKNSRLKTRYLKGITTEQLFTISFYRLF